MMVNAQEWLLDFLRFYRKLGFFEEYLHLSNAELADLLMKIIAPQDLEQECHREDFMVLTYDKKRVHYALFDLFNASSFSQIKNIGYGGRLHEEILIGWANISRGLFSPKDIEVTWQSAEEPIKVEFILANKSHNLRIEPDFIMVGDEAYYPYDISTLAKLAESLEPCMKEVDHYFTIWDLKYPATIRELECPATIGDFTIRDLGNPALVIILTPHEKGIIKENRGANFL
jgi:hypothetical protein